MDTKQPHLLGLLLGGGLLLLRPRSHHLFVLSLALFEPTCRGALCALRASIVWADIVALCTGGTCGAFERAEVALDSLKPHPC